MSSQDEASITVNDATVKDMEGAVVAYVADLLKVPAIFVKAVTDIVDGEKPTTEEPAEFGCNDCCTKQLQHNWRRNVTHSSAPTHHQLLEP